MNKTTDPTPADLTEHTGHTPGPWIWGWKQLAHVYGKHEGNARLIAAAPELLEALKLYMAQYDDPVNAMRLIDIIPIIRAAIARAEGKPTLQ